jgi:hypothetical protein
MDKLAPEELRVVNSALILALPTITTTRHCSPH